MKKVKNQSCIFKVKKPMIKIITILFILISTPVVYSENNLNHTEHAHEHDSVHENNTLSLDHGVKWKMDPHTRKMFASMSERIHEGGDLKVIGGKLNEDLQTLIQGCTMTGLAHDQLHLLLAPYIPAVRELSQEGTEKALQEVKYVLNHYESYFE